MIEGHGGNIFQAAKTLGCHPSAIMDMSSNVSPLGMPPGLVETLQERCNELVSLPEVNSASLCADFAAAMGLKNNQVLAGNGSTEFIYMVPSALRTRRALIVGPTYSDYADACRACGIEPVFWFAREKAGFEPDLDEISSRLAQVDTVFLCNPNNPTGQLIPAQSLIHLVEACPDVRFVVDESYLPFVPHWEAESLGKTGAHNVIVLQSFSKVFAIPGLRLGFLVAAPEMIQAFHPFRQPWSVNRMAQLAGSFLLSKKGVVEEVARFTQKEREAFLGYLQGMSVLSPFPSAVHFVLFRLNGTLTSKALVKALEKSRILIRDCSNFRGLSERFVRIALKGSDTNRRCAQILREVAAGYDH